MLFIQEASGTKLYLPAAWLRFVEILIKQVRSLRSEILRLTARLFSNTLNLSLEPLRSSSTFAFRLRLLRSLPDLRKINVLSQI